MLRQIKHQRQRLIKDVWKDVEEFELENGKNHPHSCMLRLLMKHVALIELLISKRDQCFEILKRRRLVAKIEKLESELRLVLSIVENNMQHREA